MSLVRARVSSLLQGARHAAEGVLLETEAMAILEAIGIGVPRRITFPSADQVPCRDPLPLPGERVVLKALGPRLLHKTELGAVAVVANARDAVVAETRAMERRLAGHGLDGFVLYEYVEHDRSLGHELLVGLRFTEAFGPVVTVGPGGIHAEFLSRAFPPGEGLTVLAPEIGDPAGLSSVLSAVTPVRLVTEPQRGRPALLDLESVTRVARAFLALAEEYCPKPIAELEINPLVVSEGRLVALDALLTLSGPPPAVRPPRPVYKIRQLLEPRTIAMMGVSEKINPGRIMLQNTLRAGFAPESIVVVKPGRDTLEGCRCVPSLEALPAPVDLLVLSLPAAQAAEALVTAVESRRAESILLIPGGLEERSGGEPMVARMRDALLRSRATAWSGPVVNGGNCLGVRSAPGAFDTLFIPQHKLPSTPSPPSPLALVTGSGAFAASMVSKLDGIVPRYVISIGNQMDLTVGDYLEYLADDPEVRVAAVYLEGFRPLDGERFLRATQRMAASGSTVVLYAAGRTAAGASAAASHTAAVAGDHLVTDRLARAAGALVADSLEDFGDLVRVALRFGAAPLSGLGLGACSNAGYECVAIADHLGPFTLATFEGSTVAGLAAVLERARVRDIVTIRNPIDLTPILGDADFAEAVGRVLADPAVDVGLVGCVPLTGALETLPARAAHREDVRHSGSVVQRLIRLGAEIAKPWAVVIDAGRLYDPMVEALEAGGIITFRSSDRALRVLARFCEHRLAARHALAREFSATPPVLDGNRVASLLAGLSHEVTHDSQAK